MSSPEPVATTHRKRPLNRLLSDAPNLLPRLARLAPAFFARSLRRPVFMVGCGRSGKTVVADLLGRHPDIALYPGEANHLWHPGLYPWYESPHRGQVPPIWYDAVGFARGSAAHRTPQDVQRLRATFGAYQMLQGRRIFLNESALTSVLLPFIVAEFPTARIIHVVRDGRAVAPAWARRQAAQIQNHAEHFRDAELQLDFAAVLDRCATSWNQQVVDVARYLGPAHSRRPGYVFEMRYETFCDRPAVVLDALAQWLAIDPAPLVETDLSHIANRNADDSADIGTDAVQHIETLMREGLTLHGYLAVPAATAALR